MAETDGEAQGIEMSGWEFSREPEARNSKDEGRGNGDAPSGKDDAVGSVRRRDGSASLTNSRGKSHQRRSSNGEGVGPEQVDLEDTSSQISSTRAALTTTRRKPPSITTFSPDVDKNKRSGEELWNLARRAVFDGRIFSIRNMVDRRPQSSSTSSDPSQRSGFSLLKRSISMFSSKKDAMDDEVSRKKGKPTFKIGECQTAEGGDGSMDPVTALMHDVCSALGFAYAEIWIRPPVDPNAVQATGNDEENPDIRRESENLSGGEGGTAPATPQDQNRARLERGHLSFSRRIGALVGKSHSNSSLPPAPPSDGRTTLTATATGAGAGGAEERSGSPAMRVGSLGHTSSLPTLGAIMGRGMDRRLSSGHAANSTTSPIPERDSRDSMTRDMGFGERPNEDSLLNQVVWGSFSYVHLEQMQEDMAKRGEAEDWQTMVRALQEKSEEEGVKYDKGKGLPGQAWQVATKLDWQDLTQIDPLEAFVFNDSRLTDVKRLFDMSVAVKIMDPAETYMLGILLLYKVVPETTDPAKASARRKTRKNYYHLSCQESVKGLLEQAGRSAFWSIRLHSATKAWAHLREQCRLDEERLSMDLALHPTDPAHPDAFEHKSLFMRSQHFLWKYLKKFRGQKATPPGPNTWQFSLWAFFGTYIGVFILTSINQRMKEIAFGDYYIFVLINSMGAVAAMLFSAPTSPLVQPRNLFGGHLIAAVTAVTLDYLSNEEHHPSTYLMPSWVSAPMAPMITIFIQAKVGLIHPPSCSACLIYGMGLPYVKNVGWLYVACPVLLDCTLLCITAVLINNLSKDRSYPLYW